MTSQNYGPLTDLVKYSGLLISAAAAIGIAWRRNANWEPSEQDLPKGPSRVAGLLTAVIIAVIWTQFSSESYQRPLAVAAIVLGTVCLLAFLTYGYFIARQTFDKEISVDPNQSKWERIVGGFRLTPDARRGLSRAGSIQRLFKGAGYDPDLIWTRDFESPRQATVRSVLHHLECVWHPCPYLCSSLVPSIDAKATRASLSRW
jgi:hypothetical protein